MYILLGTTLHDFEILITMYIIVKASFMVYKDVGSNVIFKPKNWFLDSQYFSLKQ